MSQQVMFQGLFNDSTPTVRKKSDQSVRVSRKKLPRKELWGCENCSLNKLKETVPSKAIFEPFDPARPIWILAMNPARNEILQKRNLCGPAGQLFWRRVEKLGVFTREQCNVDNVVRCRSSKLTPDGIRIEAPPDKTALKCCQKHTQDRYQQAKPKVILLLGNVAQKQFLGKKYQKNKTVYWDEEKQCKIICAYHPSYFLRGGGSREHWAEWDRTLREVRNAIENPGRFGQLSQLDYQRIKTPERLKKLFRSFAREKKRVSVDAEWGVVNGKQKIICMAFSNQKGWARIVFFDHPELKQKSLRTVRLIRTTCQFLSSPVGKILWHGVSDANEVRKRWGVEINGYETDGEFTEYFKFPNRKNYQLETAVDLRLKKMSGYKEVVEDYIQEERNFARVPVQALTIRCCGDADATRRLTLSAEKDIPHELVKMYVQASFVLEEMGERGMLHDSQHSSRMRKRYEPLLKEIVEKIRVLAGDPDFTITDENLKKLFVTRLKIGLRKLTPAGEKAVKEAYPDVKWINSLDSSEVRDALKKSFQEKWWKAYSLGREVMDELYKKHQIVPLIIQKRFIDKLLNTHLDGFQESADANKGYCRTRFKLTVASTGRLSSGGDKKGSGSEKKKVNFQNIHGDPMAQNVLISTERWVDIVRSWEQRKHDPEWLAPYYREPILLARDCSQAEIRMLAQLSGDKLLCAQLNTGEDIHPQVAHEVFGWSIEKVKKEKKARVIAKALHFGIIFGLQDEGIYTTCRALGIDTTLDEIREKRRRYFQRYKGVRDYIEYCIEYVAKHGRTVPNLFGMSRPLEVSDGRDGGAYWKNQAVNTPVQGSAAQYLVLVLAILQEQKKYELLRSRMRNEIHDALVSSPDLQALAGTDQLMQDAIENRAIMELKDRFQVKMNIPMVSEASVGFRMGVMIDYENKETHFRQEQLEKLVGKWCIRNKEVEAEWEASPLKFIEKQRGK